MCILRRCKLWLVSLLLKCFHNALLMLMAECLHSDNQLHRRVAVDADKLVMFQFNNIALLLRNQRRNIRKLTRFVRQKHGNGENPAPRNQPMLYNRGHRNHIHIAAA